MNKRQKHLENIEKLQKAVEIHPTIEDMKKSLILEKIEEWKHDEEAMELIPNKLVELYEEDIKPILVELGLL
jgi:alcohol dehydrogenase class IV